MEKFIFYILFIFIIIIANIYSHTLFPGPKSAPEQMCLNQSATLATLDNCIKIEPQHAQEACCYVTYKNKENEEFSQCGYLENTEHGINIFKHLFAEYKNVKIQCESFYIKKFILINFSSLIFLLLL